MKSKILLFLLFFSFILMNAETQTRYYNGTITKDKVIEKLERYFDFLKSKNIKLQKSEVKSKYDFKVSFDYPINENSSVLSSVLYKIDDDRITITLEKCALFRKKEKDISMLSKNAEHIGLRNIYSGQAFTYFDMPFTHMNIEKNINLSKTQTLWYQKTKPDYELSISYDPKSKGICISGDCNNGFGKMNLGKGEIYYGYFSEGKMNGIGLISRTGFYFLFSEFKNNISNGFVLELKSDITFIGTTTKGKINGNGFSLADGNKMKGGFYSDNALWVEHPFAQNAITKKGGCYRGDCKNMLSLYKYMDGSIFTGFFANEKPSLGTMLYYTGDNSYGNMKNMKMNGVNMYEYNTVKEIYFGNFTENKHDGNFLIIKQKENKVYGMTFKNGTKISQTQGISL